MQFLSTYSMSVISLSKNMFYKLQFKSAYILLVPTVTYTLQFFN